ncbi:glycosyltransferase family 4 protein [Nonlabens antarcticus]|uniref:glycosyltransferase family 4 protein n=1 Tax=Nonlabens antarcticus TaxID=392714 RepID=UPI001891B8C4|nr:glycosyltransferase family 4 protein [Nonlabens antarcticus]
MRILIVTQYFYPENFRINDVALGLKDLNHEVTVLTGKPNYPKGVFYDGYGFFKPSKETWKGISIHRSPLVPRGKGGGLRLIINYLSFAVFASLKSLFIKGDFDAVFVYEPSPITVGLPAITLGKRKKVPVYFWVQDLWPESIEAAGQLSNRNILALVNKFTKWVYRNSKKILIQSPGFKEYILNQNVSESKILYFPNSTESFYKVVEPRIDIQKQVPDSAFTVMFAGNIGEAQDFDNIIEAFRIILNTTKEINLVILGDGRKRNEIEQQIIEEGLNQNIIFLGSRPPETMPHYFACADALLVSLKDERIFSLTIPSKLQSYMACGKPIIASLDGTASRIVNESKSGRSCKPGNPNDLAKVILEMFELNDEERKVLGQNALNYCGDNFNRDKLLFKLTEILSGN